MSSSPRCASSTQELSRVFLWPEFPCRELAPELCQHARAGGHLPGERCAGPSQGAWLLSSPSLLSRAPCVPSTAVTAGCSCPPAPEPPSGCLPGGTPPADAAGALHTHLARAPSAFVMLATVCYSLPPFVSVCFYVLNICRS